ncbi:MAG: PSD1 and planctomycete cytochrome C domain-containing protein [Isosphaeraceae bacterium]
MTSWLLGLATLALGTLDDPTTPPDVRAVLARCASCHGHGPEGDESAGGLDLTTRDAALKGGESGKALVPGDPKRSPLVSRVVAGKMPPRDPLPAAQVEALRAWVASGARWDQPIGRDEALAASASAQPAPSSDLWSLRPVQNPPTPPVRDRSWLRDPIDAFILARLETEGLAPAPEVDRATYIRRVSFDLIGLPPTPEEVAAFVADRRPDAHERVVDRLLASPRYGERWGRHWLDLARFAESQGFEYDRLRDHAWRYRDYVIARFNADVPYDQFVSEQIAGDVLPGAGDNGIIATGFLVAGPWDEAGSKGQKSVVMRERVREDELEEMVSAVGATFLGLTIHCARCHDHKFDPIPQRDYYRIKAALEGVGHADRPLQPAGKSSRLVYAASPFAPPATQILNRGEVTKKGEAVTAGGLSRLAVPPGDFGLGLDAPEADRRRALARWITHPDHPLTPRVLVNRLWHYHFGVGLVGTPSDFGTNGERPTHPELLDHLATDLRKGGGRLKPLHRRIVLSAAYRQSSAFNERAAARDADARLLWRFPPRRLEGEAVRDALLFVSGALDPSMGGPGFRPFVIRTFNSNFYEMLPDAAGPGFDRRTIYKIHVNSAKSPLLDALDCPDPSVKTPRRAVTTTPLQALGLMNDPFVLRMARSMVRRLDREEPSEPAGSRLDRQVVRAYRLTLGRDPSSDEVRRAVALARRDGLESLAWVLFNCNEFLTVR